MSENKTSGRGRRTWVLASIVGVVVLLGALWVGAYFAAGDKVPANATVDSVAIGGLSPSEAEQTLRDELEPRYSAPLTVTSPQDVSITLEPLESGLVLDYAGAVRASGGGSSWNPADIWRTFTGGREIELPRTVDESRITEVLEDNAGDFVADATDATLAFEDASITRTDGAVATVLDVPATTEKVAAALEQGATEAEATVTETPPAVTTAMVDAAVSSYAEPAVSAPVTITAPKGSFDITPAQVAAVTTFVPEGDALVHKTDVDALMELTADGQKGLGLAATKDASYAMSDGAITVVPAVDGETIDAKGLAAALESAAVKSGAERTAAVEVTKKPAKFTTAQATELKPREVIGEFTTKFPHAPYRNTNLGKAASTVNGTVLMPDEIFSLNETLGERTARNGYVDGYVINGGVLVKEPGGGISQSSTTLFNAAFFAGYEDIEHKPHSLYFNRYPAGREATIYYGKLDMRFRNDTKYPAYIQGFVNKSSSGKQGTITFKIWSIPTWDKVTSTDLVKSGFYSGKTRTLSGPKCEAQAPIQGFSVNWKRQFWKDGKVAKSEDWYWKYSAGDRIVCE
ncbi:MAG: VanW family protein [Propionibacteriaceae bacterium]|nr:VanW family protein [Propionibacteriaceae bacterium]